jgi:hypothetical protein
MSRGGQANDDQAGLRVAEAGNRASPVIIRSELFLLLARHAFSVGDKSGAPTADHDFFAEALETIGQGPPREGPRRTGSL